MRTELKVWTTKAGLEAVMHFNPHCGHYCGYVGIDQQHPLYGKKDNDRLSIKIRGTEPIDKLSPITLLLLDDGEPRVDWLFNVHGGLTWSGPLPSGIGIDSPLWWFGFDCGHDGDANKYLNGVFRDEPYVIHECETLAKMLAEFPATYMAQK